MIIEDFFNSLKIITRLWPDDDSYRMPQTFAVMDSILNLNSENLEKNICDKNKPYFYSRLWESLSYSYDSLKFTWPLVTLFEESFEIKDANTHREQTIYTYIFYCLHSFDSNKDTCEPPNGRLRQEYYKDTEFILKSYIKHISDLRVYDMGNGPVFLTKELANIYNTECCGDFKELNGYTTSFQSSFKSLNESIRGSRIDNVTVNKLYGTTITLRIPINTQCNEISTGFGINCEEEHTIYSKCC